MNANDDDRIIPSPVRGNVTGVILAGGRGRRMGGVDKALLVHQGQPLLAHALYRLTPQVAAVQISTARGEVLKGFEHPALKWVADPLPDHPGPLVGLLAGLQGCVSPWMVSVPCDAPRLPLDLVRRLAQGWAAQARTPGTRSGHAAVAGMAVNGSLRMEPAFALLHRSCAPSLEAAILAGERALHRWLHSLDAVTVPFDDHAAFFNVNTPQDLQP